MPKTIDQDRSNSKTSSISKSRVHLWLLNLELIPERIGGLAPVEVAKVLAQVRGKVGSLHMSNSTKKTNREQLGI